MPTQNHHLLGNTSLHALRAATVPRVLRNAAEYPVLAAAVAAAGVVTAEDGLGLGVGLALIDAAVAVEVLGPGRLLARSAVQEVV